MAKLSAILEATGHAAHPRRLPVVLLVAFTAACGTDAAQEPAAPQIPPAFGITNSSPEGAALLLNAGVSWHRSASFIRWGDVQASATSGYDWTEADALVRGFQQPGGELQGMLSPFSVWASDATVPTAGVDAKSYPPYTRYMGDWERFVAAVVERYDLDGDPANDMPGLLRPIHFWQLGNEFYNRGHWGGTIDEYLDLLARTRQAAVTASSDARVIANEVADVHAFDTLDVAEIEARAPAFFASDPAGMFIARELAAQDSYDIFITHFNGRARFIPVTVQFYRAQLERLGPGRPLWGGCAASGVLLARDPLSTRDPAVVTREQALLDILAAGSTDPSYAATEAWYRREQAREAARKPVAIVASGVRHLYLTALTDWPRYALASWRFHGLVECSSPGCPSPVPRAAFHSYAFAIEMLGEAQGARRLDLGPGVWAFEWTTQGHKRLCLWADDADITDMSEPAVGVSIDVGAWTAALVSTPPLAMGQTASTARVVGPVGGTVQIDLTPDPVFVEEAL